MSKKHDEPDPLPDGLIADLSLGPLRQTIDDSLWNKQTLCGAELVDKRAPSCPGKIGKVLDPIVKLLCVSHRRSGKEKDPARRRFFCTLNGDVRERERPTGKFVVVNDFCVRNLVQGRKLNPVERFLEIQTRVQTHNVLESRGFLLEIHVPACASHEFDRLVSLALLECADRFVHVREKACERCSRA